MYGLLKNDCAIKHNREMEREKKVFVFFKKRKTGMVMGANIKGKVSFELMLSPDHAILSNGLLFFSLQEYIILFGS